MAAPSENALHPTRLHQNWPTRTAYSFSMKIWNTNKKENEIKNQLITCIREEKWKSNISPLENTKPLLD
ncbi:hypothetical protein Ahy_B10g102436 [Arachis hypogaea]|uniref:Uncharacterized protein n=1 Tax=Arachis hypogaea TaxID=3818 RepID=A0A444X1Y7_ARAHY|nr:hypothetical protein Ahy_B10g102436 [Arachis hypogaea]